MKIILYHIFSLILAILIATIFVLKIKKSKKNTQIIIALVALGLFIIFSFIVKKIEESEKLESYENQVETYILGLKENSKLIFKKNMNDEWADVNEPNQSINIYKITQMKDGTLIGSGADTMMYKKTKLTDNWELIPNSGYVYGVAALPDGKIIGIGTNWRLYYRDSLTSIWNYLNNNNDINVKTITVDSQGRIYASKNNNNETGTLVKSDINAQWAPFGQWSFDVLGTAPDNTIIGLLPNDNNIYNAQTNQVISASRTKIRAIITYKKTIDSQDIIRQMFNRQLTLLESNKNSATMQLSDKNRLIANANSDIQRAYMKLSEINDRINTVTQDIYSTNIDVERKDMIIKTMRAILTIMFILLLTMVVYYGSNLVEERFPGMYNTLKNGFSTNPFKFT